MTDGVTVVSLSASLLQKISAVTYRLRQISIYLNLAHKFEKWCKFSSCVKAKSRKKKSGKTRTVAIFTCKCDSWSAYKILATWLLLMGD
jgi:hypothetical protein